MREVCARLQVSFPALASDLLALHEPVQLDAALNAGTCSGSCHVVMSHDGFVEYTGHVHNSGAVLVAYVEITSVPVTDDGGAIIIAHKGHVAGTFAFGSRDDSWDETASNPSVAEHWAAVKLGAASAVTEFGTDAGATELLDGLAGVTGAWVFHL